MTWHWDERPEKVVADVFDAYARRVRRELIALAKRFAPQIEAWMKQNATWTDRTGNARQGLKAEVEIDAFEIAIVLDHGVDYGFYLEFAHQGEYAIIDPAVDYWSVRFYDAVQDLMSS